MGILALISRISQASVNKGADPDQVLLIENGIDATELLPKEYNQGESQPSRKNLEFQKIIKLLLSLHGFINRNVP